MLLSVVASLAAALGVSFALDFDGPQATEYAGLDPRGFSPQPTAAPYYQLHRRKLQKRDLTDTCAYVNGAALTCPSGQYCAYGTAVPYMGCCTTDANGQFDSGCQMTTSCVNQAESSLLCPVASTAACPGPLTGVCEANINAAQCLTFVLYYGTATWTTFRCGTSAERLIATLSPSSGETTTTTPAVITTTTPATTTTNPAITTPSPTAATDIGPTTIYSTTTPQTTPTAPPPSSHTAAIAGGAVGGIAGLLIIGGLLGFIIHRIRVKKRENGFVDDPPEMSGTTYTPK